MDLTIFDILILFILAITVSLIIAANVIYVVDKKLSDIQINVPPCPTPVCPKLMCSTLSESLTPDTLSTNTKTKSQMDLIVKSEADAIKKSKSIEHFVSPPYEPPEKDYAAKNADYQAITAQAYTDQIQHKLDPKFMNKNIPQVKFYNSNGGDVTTPLKVTNDNSTLLLRQGYNSHNIYDSNAQKLTDINESIERPRSDDIIRYNGNGCYRDINNDSIRKIRTKQINNRSPCRPYIDTVVEGDENTLDTKFMSPTSNNPNEIKKVAINFYVPKLYMGRDPNVSGVSYASMTIEEPADIDQIGSIPLNDYDGEPIPISDFVY